MVNIKGNILYHYKNHIIKTFGEDYFKDMQKNFDDEVKSFYEGAILSNNWYSIKNYHQLIEQLNSRLGLKNLTKFTISVAQRQMLFFGLILRVAKPNWLLSKADSFWHKLFDEGDIPIAMLKENKIYLKVTGFHFHDLHLHTFAAYQGMLAERILKQPIIRKFNRIDDMTTEFIFEY